MGKPDFIGIGTERAGTSWVFSMLAHHPEIWTPPLKELHYFDEIDDGVPTHSPRYGFHLKSRIKHKIAPFLNLPTRPELFKNSYLKYLQWDAAYFTGAQNDEWYQNLFAEKFTRGRTCGEYTPAYSNVSNATIDRMKTMNAGMKFILILRNPLQQIRSSLIQNFVMIEGRHFESVGEDDMHAWLDSPFASKKANITEILNTWQNAAGNHLFIGLYEEISGAPAKLIKRLYTHLDVDGTFLPDEKFYSRKVNNLTKPTYEIPQSVQDRIIETFTPEVETFKSAHPELAKFWSTP